MPEGVYALAEPGGGVTALNMYNEFNLFGTKSYLAGRSFEFFPMINDAPVEKEIVKEKKGSWWGNLLTGIVVTVALAGLAVATVATGGAALAVVCLAGAAVGAGVVTATVAVTDHNRGEARSWGEFLGNLVMGAGLGALAGASIYGLWTALPVVGQAAGLQVSIWTGVVSPLTYSTIPAIVTAGGYGLMGAQGARYLNEIASFGSGQNWLLDNAFGGNQGNYEAATMLLDMMTMGYMETARNNPGLGKSKGKELPSYADDQLDDIDAETWDDGPVSRGSKIDNSDKLKNNLGSNFPIADKLENGVLSSTKSYDINCKTYQDASKFLSKLKGDINKLNGFVSKTWNGVTVPQSSYTSKQLNVVLPNTTLTIEQQNALESAKQYANSLGINIKVYITQ